MASGKFRALKINLAISFTRKLAGMHNDAVPLNEAQVEYFDLQSTLKIRNLSVFRLPASQPACLP